MTKRTRTTSSSLRRSINTRELTSVTGGYNQAESLASAVYRGSVNSLQNAESVRSQAEKLSS